MLSKMSRRNSGVVTFLQRYQPKTIVEIYGRLHQVVCIDDREPTGKPEKDNVS
jgi:hypothetical protein